MSSPYHHSPDIAMRQWCLERAIELAQRNSSTSVGTAAQQRPSVLLSQTSDIVLTAREFYGFAQTGRAPHSEMKGRLEAAYRDRNEYRAQVDRLSRPRRVVKKRKAAKKKK